MNERIMMTMFTTSIFTTAVLSGLIGAVIHKHLRQDD